MISRDRLHRALDAVMDAQVTKADRIRALGKIEPHRYVTPKRGSANLPCMKCGLSSWEPEHTTSTKDARSGIGANTLKMAAQAMKASLKEGRTLAEATRVYQDTLAQLLIVPTKDGFQVTAVGMKKVADAKRRDFLLMAYNSEVEAENLRREGNTERAKKFLAQEAKWRAMAARSDEEIYREYKTSQ